MHIGKGPVHVEQIDLDMDEDGKHYQPTRSPEKEVRINAEDK
jgi:hypothetical protein